MLEEKSVKANRHGICHHGGSLFAVAKLTVRCCMQHVKKSAARLGSTLKIVKNFWEIWALMQEEWLLCLPEIDTYCAFRLA